MMQSSSSTNVVAINARAMGTNLAERKKLHLWLRPDGGRMVVHLTGFFSEQSVLENEAIHLLGGSEFDLKWVADINLSAERNTLAQILRQGCVLRFSQSLLMEYQIEHSYTFQVAEEKRA